MVLKTQMEKDESQSITLTCFSDKNTSINPKQPDSKVPFFTNFTSLRKIFRNLNNKRSSGLDGIPTVVLKHLPNNIIWLYKILFNNIMNNSHFPKEWKKAKVIAITKKGKEGTSPSDLRPISLLPNISKVFETMISQSLTNFCSKNKIIPDNQFGFKHKDSTNHAINKLTLDIYWALN